MSFLTPWFLLGGLALGLPVVFHLIQRTTRERTLFSTLRFLRPSPPRLTKRNRLNNILLLLLRCLALILLALGFARPFLTGFSHRIGSQGTQRLLILLDASASMRRGVLWEEALQSVKTIVGNTSAGDEVAVYTFDRELQPVMTHSEWGTTTVGQRHTFALSRLNSLKPSWSATRLGLCLQQAAEILSEQERDREVPVRRRLILVSDQQEGSHADLLAGYEWPPGIELDLAPVRAKSGNNAGLQWIYSTADPSKSVTNGYQVRVNNATDAQRDRFQVGWSSLGSEQFIGQAVEVRVPPGQSRAVTLPPRPSSSAEAVQLLGDDEPFDNRIYLATAAKERTSVLYLGADRTNEARQPLFFLRSALTRDDPAQLDLRAHAPTDTLSPADLSDLSLIVVTDPLPDLTIALIQEQLERGVPLLFSPKTSEGGQTLAKLAGVQDLIFEDIIPKDYALLGEMDFQHPLLAPFSDPKFQDFTRIHFWKFRRLKPSTLPEARIVARFDTGDPALLELPFKKSRIIILTSGWSSVDSQLALSTKFVPWIDGLLDPENLHAEESHPWLVGDAVTLVPSSVDRQVRLPDGTMVSLAAHTNQFSRTSLPGIYRLEGTGASTTWSVNLDPVESQTAPLAADTWTRFGTPVGRATPASTTVTSTAAAATETEGQQKLWRWFLVGTWVILLLESIVARFTYSRQATLIPSLA